MSISLSCLGILWGFCLKSKYIFVNSSQEPGIEIIIILEQRNSPGMNGLTLLCVEFPRKKSSVTD